MLMPVVTRSIVHTKTRQPIPWAFATTLTGELDTKLLMDAVALVTAEKKRNPQLVAWLIDAQGISSRTLDQSVKVQIFVQLVAVRGIGIQAAGLILPVLDADDMRTIHSKLPGGTKAFFSQVEAQKWFDASCPK